MICASLLTAEINPDQIAIPQDTIDKIKAQAAEKWPNDYSMQAYTIKQQKEGYKKSHAWYENYKHNEAARNIFDTAQEKWPNDYAMQFYEIEKQVEGLLKIGEE